MVWDLGPHDFSILRYWLGETPARGRGASARLHLPGTSRRRVHQPRVRERRDRARRAVVARAEQAAPDGRSSARRRWSSTTTRAPSRCAIFDSGVELHDPETFGEYRLTYRTGDIVSPRVDVQPSRSRSSWRDFCRAIREVDAAALLGAARARRRADDRGGRRVAVVDGQARARRTLTLCRSPPPDPQATSRLVPGPSAYASRLPGCSFWG